VISPDRPMRRNTGSSSAGLAPLALLHAGSGVLNLHTYSRRTLVRVIEAGVGIAGICRELGPVVRGGGDLFAPKGRNCAALGVVSPQPSRFYRPVLFIETKLAAEPDARTSVA